MVCSASAAAKHLRLYFGALVLVFQPKGLVLSYLQAPAPLNAEADPHLQQAQADLCAPSGSWQPWPCQLPLQPSETWEACTLLRQARARPCQVCLASAVSARSRECLLELFCGPNCIQGTSLRAVWKKLCSQVQSGLEKDGPSVPDQSKVMLFRSSAAFADQAELISR